MGSHPQSSVIARGRPPDHPPGRPPGHPWTRRWLLLAALYLCACGSEPRPDRDRSPRAAPIEESAPDGVKAQTNEKSANPEYPPYKARRPVMGTIIEITVLGLPEAKAAAAVTAALAKTAEIEELLSEWKPTSEISRINRAAGKHPVKVSHHTMTVVRAGLEISRWSGGAFDLSWAALRGLYLFQPGEEKVPDQAEIDARLPLIRYQDIIVDESASTVMLKREGMLIGTGGIAKGYSLDIAADVLRAAGATSFMFFGGGQVQVHGLKGDRPWRIGIQNPRRDDYIGFLESSGGSVSTSGDYEHSFIRDGKRWHHLLDPRTGLPVDHTMSVSVLADSGLYADALSTAVFIMGAKRALPLLASAPANARVVVIDATGKLFISPGTEKHLVLRTELVDGKIPLQR